MPLSIVGGQAIYSNAVSDLDDINIDGLRIDSFTNGTLPSNAPTSELYGFCITVSSSISAGGKPKLQFYCTYVGRIYIRMNWNGGWKAWTNIANPS